MAGQIHGERPKLMMEQEAPPFPAYVTIPVWGAILLLVLIRAWRLRDACSTFLLIAIWFRYSIATFHQYAYPPIIFGLSLIALTSIVFVVIGLLVVGIRSLLLRRLVPIWGAILVILVSAVANLRWIEAVNAAVKWLYLIVFALATYYAARRRGSDRVFGALAIVFAGPVLLHWLSVPWGLKTTRADGSVFYLGGFQHQQSLSIILLTFLYVTCFTPSLSLVKSYGRLAIVAAGLALANYRTSLLAAGVPAATLAVSKLVEKFIPRQRSIVVLFLVVVTAFAFIGVGTLTQDRFSDFGTVFDKGASVIKPAQHFTTQDKRLFSGRLYLWSQYIEGYLDGDIINILVGFGPDASSGRFTTYAHNTFVSYLYEFGLFGLFALLWILISNLVLAARVGGTEGLILVSCHIGFIILNMSTMGLWTLEGAILYALLLGQTWYLCALRERSRGEVPYASAREPAPQRIESIARPKIV